MHGEDVTKHGKPRQRWHDHQPDARERQAGLPGVAERLVVPLKPGNAGGRKEPQFKGNANSGGQPRRLVMSLEPPPTS
jgi:hypothetical protein